MTEPNHPRGGKFLELVAVMDTLRSPGGCPWDAQQTHRSLAEYLIEECYETVEAIETDDDAGMLEELGDLLLQIVFHARIAQDNPDRPWDIDDVAEGIIDKLVRRHPHVFADTKADDAEAVVRNWTRLKAEEKGRTSALDGIPSGLPALSWAQKTLRRARESGLRMEQTSASADAPSFEGLGERLLGIVAAAEAHGLDAEAALRHSVRGLYQDVRDAEQ
ncbi:MAG: MazG family protein [Candidatus Nanopelagicales bacterium]|nr:MazG family protein [Candidatus Nanopelagicales bacterium]